VIVDALGNPLALSLTGGQVHDITQADTLAAQVEPGALLGDKGYDADSLIGAPNSPIKPLSKSARPAGPKTPAP
jgi:transposase